jgi:hypothetical protein
MHAQEVQPVISKDYIELLNKSRPEYYPRGDSSNSIKNAFFPNASNYDGHSIISKVIFHKNGLKIQPASIRKFYIGGNFASTVEIRSANRTPSLQTAYAQGRSINGVLSWQGPETNELFSYGPALNTLRYDGSNYPYDTKGRLIPSNAGNFSNAEPYNNSILRTGSFLSQSMIVQGKYLTRGQQVISTALKIGTAKENLILKDNINRSNNLTASADFTLRPLSISASYSTLTDRYSNDNRNGFLNRVYQYSLLTPASFDNSQGYLLGTGQRSYSAGADNPYFLLKDNGNSISFTRQNAGLSLEKRLNSFRIKLTNALSSSKQNGEEAYKPGTVSFENGMAISRKTGYRNYLLNLIASFTKNSWNSDFRSSIRINYSYNDGHSGIYYNPGMEYKYQRSSHDLSLNYQLIFNKNDVEAGLDLVSKTYFSNTTSDKIFLPTTGGYVSWYNFLGASRLRAKLVGTFTNFNSELPIDRSFSQNSLLQYNTEQFSGYFPVTEAITFNNLDPIRHKEWTTRLELDYGGMLGLKGEIFHRKTMDDIFPLYENGAFTLRNVASHFNRGFELSFDINSYLWRAGKLYSYTTFSFFRYRNIVTRVRDGYNFTPIAGFSNVNKVIAEGEPLGAIAGNTFLKENNIVKIGNDGFPLVDMNQSVIGDPTPDFVMKFNQNLTWRRFNFNLDIEWKKGGDIWNGTQAVLDYYGRSGSSANLRNTRDYVFKGVLPNGQPNTIPVDFYDPALPIEQNRWVRYGYTGVAEEYIQRADHLRINNIGIGYNVKPKKILENFHVMLYISNIMIWTPYQGADPNQLLFDQPQTNGLDFFNLPSNKTFGCSVSLQF